MKRFGFAAVLLCLGLVTVGCGKPATEKVDEKKQELNEARQEAAQESAELQQEANEKAGEALEVQAEANEAAEAAVAP